MIGHGAELLVKELGSETNFVTQEQQLGTGHAVLQTEKSLAGFNGQIVVISADMPLLRKETIAGLIQKQKDNPGSLTLLTVTGEESRGFGRIIRDSDGNVTGNSRRSPGNCRAACDKRIQCRGLLHGFPMDVEGS